MTYDGPDKFIAFAEDFLGTRLGETQKRALRAIVNHQRVLIVSGNGVGKSYVVAVMILAFLYTNAESTVLGTSGSYSQFVDTMWRPMKELWKRASEEHGLPGRMLAGGAPELRIDDDWYAKVVSPRDHGDLEGRHAPHVLVVIEEADKEYITSETFDSAASSITDDNDRMIAIANPPDDENDVVYEKMQSDRWHTIQFDSFESHNVQVDLGKQSDRIPGLVDLDTIEDDWEAWNNEDWPGYQTARTAHEHRKDLDSRWYRRRAGIIPPDTAVSFRPFGVSVVEDAYDPTSEPSGTQVGVGIDVARMGGDSNVIALAFEDHIAIPEIWKGVDHNANYRTIGRESGVNKSTGAIDAQGEGSGVADRVTRDYSNIARFNAGGKAEDERKFYDCWSEGLYHLGQFLKDGGTFANKRLYEELLSAARVIEFEEKHYASRDATVLKASRKKEIKSHLGRSPDVLDAAYMAMWAAEASGRRQVLTW